MKRKIIIAIIAVIMAVSIPTTTFAEERCICVCNQNISEDAISACFKYGKEYNICPELIIAVVEYESNGNPNALGKDGDCGLMQVIPQYHYERAEKLGYERELQTYFETDSNIHIGTDYLAELFRKYDDVCLVLMCYNQGEKSALKDWNNGIISDYALNITEITAELERNHGK